MNTPGPSSLSLFPLAKGAFLPRGRTGFAAALALLAAVAAAGASQDSQDSLVLQQGRAAGLAKSAAKTYYPSDAFDLADLPAYAPEQSVSGTVRLWGADTFAGAGFKANLTNGFRKFQPGATVEFKLKANLLALSGLLEGTAQIGTTHALTWETLLGFQRLYGYDPLTIGVTTGWAVNPPFSIMVNAANPLGSLTMKQLDGIYGAQRSGGWVGTSWHSEFARGPEGDLRTWGQLGLSGEWKDKPIDPYGYSIRCMFGVRFSNSVLQGGDKWNPAVQERFIVSHNGSNVSMDEQMAEELGRNRYGIAFLSALRVKNPAIKALAIAASEGAAAVPLTLQTVRDRSYPLGDSVYFFINRKPGTPLEPVVREFMRFILSREGQTAVMSDGKMLPLTAECVGKERKKLD